MPRSAPVSPRFSCKNRGFSGAAVTGGLAHSHYVTGYLTQKLSFIAPVEVMAGEFELEALAAGASRVLNGQEQPRRFADIPQA